MSVYILKYDFTLKKTENQLQAKFEWLKIIVTFTLRQSFSFLIFVSKVTLSDFAVW